MSLYDVTSDFNLAGSLPAGAARRALDSEIAGEGGKVVGDASHNVVILSNGEQVNWTPPGEKLNLPDLSTVKSLRHYFNRGGFKPYPAWLYHPALDPRLVKDAREAAELGIVYRQATETEKAKYGAKDVWDWEEGCEWRPTPIHAPKFDPKNPGSGKTVIHAKASDAEIVAGIVPQVAAAVAAVLKAQGGAPSAPASVDPAQWAQFQEFIAWQKSHEAVSAAVQDVALSDGEDADSAPSDNDLLANALTPEQDRMLWESEASRLGVRVHKNWTLETLKAKVEEAQAAA